MTCGTLPKDAQELLRKASKVENTRRDPRARDKAIDAAYEKIRGMYPHLFRDQ